MRSAQVYYKNELAGLISQFADGSFEFTYDAQWFSDSSKPAVSLTLPKTTPVHSAQTLFPFFFNMIPEGVNKQLVCLKQRIDQDDYFGILLAVANADNIGAVQIKALVS